MRLADLISQPDDNAVVIEDDQGNSLKYSALQTLIDHTEKALRAAGVGPRDTVAYALPNRPQTAALFLALASYCRVAPINPRLKAAEIAFALRDLQATSLITTPDLSEAVAASSDAGVKLIWLEADGAVEYGLTATAAARTTSEVETPYADDVALLLHTSGTTARPKLVGLTHRQLLLSSRAIADVLRLTPDDRCLSIMPFFHIHGLVAGVLASISAGARICCPPGFQVTSFYSSMAASRATWYTAVPAMHQAILARSPRHPDLLGSHRLRFIRSSSSPLFPAVSSALESTFGVPVLNAYGMTEAAHQISTWRLPDEHRPAARSSVGFSSGPEIAILSEKGALLSHGERGEIALRGDQIIRAYLSPESANQSSFTDGWFRTGDEGCLAANGEVTLTGRLKEMINCAGEKISPVEIDTVLMHHPAVSQAVTFGVPCVSRGERIYAAVVLRAEAAERDLQRFAGERLARFKVPEKILLLDEIPKGPTGKIQRLSMATLLGLS